MIYLINTNINGAGVSVASTSDYLKGNSTYCKFNCTKLIGGEPPDSFENFETEWAKSLKKDYKNWDCIEFRNPVDIFQLLPDDLHKQIKQIIEKSRMLEQIIENLVRWNKSMENLI